MAISRAEYDLILQATLDSVIRDATNSVHERMAAEL